MKPSLFNFNGVFISSTGPPPPAVGIPIELRAVPVRIAVDYLAEISLFFPMELWPMVLPFCLLFWWQKKC